VKKDSNLQGRKFMHNSNALHSLKIEQIAYTHPMFSKKHGAVVRKLSKVCNFVFNIFFKDPLNAHSSPSTVLTFPDPLMITRRKTVATSIIWPNSFFVLSYFWPYLFTFFRFKYKHILSNVYSCLRLVMSC